MRLSSPSPPPFQRGITSTVRARIIENDDRCLRFPRLDEEEKTQGKSPLLALGWDGLKDTRRRGNSNLSAGSGLVQMSSGDKNKKNWDNDESGGKA